MVFIPYNIFKKVGELHFLLLCDYSVNKLPVALSNFINKLLRLGSYAMYTTFPHIK